MEGLCRPISGCSQRWIEGFLLSTGPYGTILTASDTSTHGGFSVLRKHANECLPALDMTQATPTQELSAFDLHGTEWRFKHIFRGQPRRHLLTTGWSTFVTNKRVLLCCYLVVFCKIVLLYFD